MHEKRAQKALLQSKRHELAANTTSSAQPAQPAQAANKWFPDAQPAHAGGSKPPAPAPKKAIKKVGGGGGFLAGLVRTVVLEAQ
jgi:hypothetical protein